MALAERSQQPVGHDAESQTHWPPTHSRPAPQGALAPHWQLPFTQLSALPATQATQLPLAPQARKLVLVGSHVDAELQQPPHPLEALHTQVAAAPLPLHVVPAGQALPVEPQTQPPLVHRLALVASQVLH